MMKSKSLIAVLFCCALLVCKPVKAFWPIFDFTEIAPVYSQISTGVEALKNLKEQLVELKNNLSALGESIKGLGEFAKDISEKVVNAANTISQAVDDVNSMLGTDIRIGEDIKKAVDGVQTAATTISDTATASTEYISGATSGIEKAVTVGDKIENLQDKAENIINKDSSKDETETSKDVEPTKKEEVSKEPIAVLPQSQTVLKPIGVINKDVVAEKKNEKPTVGGKLKQILPNIISKKSLIEEEEEEEEVPETEDQLRIDTIKENIALILSESDSLSIQLNDLLDISLNTVHKNFEQGQEKLTEIEYVINRAQNIEEKDKKELIISLDKIKQKQKEATNKLVNVIEAVKDNYNQEYNNKVVDGYKNYEKVAIAYVKGDASKKELKDAGVNLKKSIASINVSPDDIVLKEIEKTIKTMQEDLILLKNNVKKAEDKTIMNV